MNRTTRDLLKLVGSTLAYFVAARAGLLLASINDASSPVWPATGIGILLVHYLGPRAGWGVLLGSALANLSQGTAPLVSAAIAFGATAEAALGASLLAWFTRRKAKIPFQLEAAATVASSFLPALVSATIGNAALVASGAIPLADFSRSWATWWVGDLLGALYLVPIAAFAPTREDLKAQFKRLMRPPALLLDVGLSAAATLLVFRSPLLHPHAFGLVVLLLLPALTGAAIATATTAITIATIGIFSTSLGLGPFHHGSLNANLINLQLFLAAFGLTAVVVPNLFRTRHFKLPLLTLLFGWAITSALFAGFRESEIAKDHHRLGAVVDELEQAIETRMTLYEDALRAAASFVVSSQYVTAAEWRTFQTNHGVARRHPGINGVGLLYPVPKGDLTPFKQRIAQDLQAPFEVSPVPGSTPDAAGPFDAHYVVTYFEPRAANERTIGLDVATDPVRRAALDRARDSGLPTVTAVTTLYQDENRGAGFILYFPVYGKSAVPPTAVEDRRALHTAWVSGPIIANRFFKDAIGQRFPEVAFSMLLDDEPVFRSAETPLGSTVTRAFVLGQRKFTLEAAASQHFVSERDPIGAWVAFCAAVVVLLGSSVVVSLQQTGLEANRLVELRTSELQEAMASVKLAAAASRSGFFFIEPKLDKVTYTEEAKKVLGVAFTGEREADRRRVLEAMDPEAAAAFLEALAIFYAGGMETLSYEYQLNSERGKIWIHSYLHATHRDAQGKPVKVVGVCQDITEKRNASERIARSERQLKHALEGSRGGIWDWDLVQGQIYFSKRLAEAFGSPSVVPLASAADMAGNVHPDDIPVIEASLAAHLSGSSPHHESEARLKHKDGSWNWYLTRGKVSERDATGKAVRMTGVHVDISQLKATEELLKTKSEELVVATNAKSQFLATMSHEIRTPMNGLLGMADLLADSKLDQEQREHVEIIRNSGKALLVILNDVLDLSKMDAGKLKLEAIPFALDAVARSQIELMRPTAAERGLDLVFAFDPGVATWRTGDPARLGQILLNLVNNAIKFTPTGSVTLKVMPAGRTLVRFEVVDTGIGLSTEQASSLFQPFVQADGSTSRKYGGTGLGLSICKRLAEAMGGRIGVASEVGRGSTFWFELPLQVAEAAPARLVVDESRALPPGLEILVAEDNATNQLLIRKLLERLGARVTLVNDGREAAETVAKTRFDAVLMDCQMPEMDGYEATRRIRAAGHDALPILALTANATKEDEQKCLAAGMDAYLQKPVEKKKLAETLADVLQSRKQPTARKAS